MALVAGDYKPQRTFAIVERLAVATVSQQDNAVAEAGIEFRQREKHPVAVRGVVGSRP